MKEELKNLLYPENKFLIMFNNEEDLLDFYDIIYDITIFYKYVVIADILAFLNEGHDFKSAYDYGWPSEKINNSMCNPKYNNDKTIIELPKPIKLNKNDMYQLNKENYNFIY